MKHYFLERKGLTLSPVTTPLAFFGEGSEEEWPFVFSDLEGFIFLDDFSDLDLDRVCALTSSSLPPFPDFKRTATTIWVQR